MKNWKRLWFSSALSSAFLLASSPATAQSEILIGQSIGLSGTAAPIVQEQMQGASLYFNHVNAKGGIGGKQIRLITLDDKFDPELTVENTRTLIETENVTALFMPMGTPHTQAVLPLLEQHHVPLVGPSSGSMSLHEPVHKYVFNVRTPYQREVETAIAHLARQGTTRIGVLHVNDSFGQDVLAGAKSAFTEYEIEPVFIERFKRGAPSLVHSVPRMLDTDPQAIIVVGTGSDAVESMLALRNQGYGGQLITLSNNASYAFVEGLGDHAHGVIVTQVFPSERSIATSLIQDLQTMAREQEVSNLSPSMVEGFATAKVLVEGLRRAGSVIDRAHVVTSLNSLQKFDLGGLFLTYSPRDHTGLEFVELSIIGTDGRFKR